MVPLPIQQVISALAVVIRVHPATIVPNVIPVPLGSTFLRGSA